MLYLYDKNIQSNLSDKYDIKDLKNVEDEKVSKLYTNITLDIENEKLNLDKKNLDTVITTNISQTFEMINKYFNNTLIVMIGFNKEENYSNILNNTKNNSLFFYSLDKEMLKYITIHSLSNIFFVFNLKSIYTEINFKKQKKVELINGKNNYKKIDLKKIKIFIDKSRKLLGGNTILNQQDKLVIGNIVIEDMYDYDNTLIYQLFDIHNVLNLSYIKEKKDKFEYIYDFVCEYLDNEFKRNHYCNFCNDLCVANRNKKTPHSDNGCCYYITYEGFLRFKNNGICKYQVNKQCQIKCLGCKLFTCRYYRRQGISFTTNNIFLLKNYLTRKEKLIVTFNLYSDKEKVIQKLLEKNKMPYYIYLINKSYSIVKIPRL